MTLRQLVEGWTNRATVRGVAIVDEDGLPVHDLLAEGLDGEAIAALAVTVLRHGRQLADAAGADDVGLVVIDSTAGPAILTLVDDRHTLIVLAQPDHDIGPLLREIRLARPALSQAV